MGCEQFRVDYDDAVETMKLVLLTKMSSTALRIGGALILTAALAGCDRGIKVQRVPKETATQPGNEMAASTDFHGQMSAAPPKIGYTTPKGWQEKPLSQMRAASFNVPGTNGQAADISVIPLKAGGPELEFVNMWRQELQLPAMTGDAQKESTPVSVGSTEGKLFEFASESPVIEDKWRGRTLVAMATREGMTWFFKMSGEDSLVRDQKPAYLDFLKSVSFEPASSTENAHQFLSAASVASSENANQPNSTVPAGWKKLPPTEFLLAKYAIQGDGDAKAEVNVSSLAGQGGGVLMNINRWRGQLGLAPVSESDLSKEVGTFTAGGEQGTLVDLSGKDKSGKPARLVGVIVPEATQTWFYKLMGDEKIVEQQKQAFIQFIQAAKHP